MSVQSKWIWVLALLAGLVSGYLAMPLLQTETNAPPGMRLGGDFQLESAQGPVSLANFQGKALVITFGFTSCPDACPAGLANLAAALDQMNEQDREHTRVLFVSLDPERDDVQTLAEYADYFHPHIIGSTGNKEQLDEMVKRYGGFYRKVDLPDSALGYTIDHSTRVYLLNPQGEVTTLLYHNSAPQQIAAELAKLLPSSA